MQKVLRLDPRDNVLIALADLKLGETIECSGNAYSLVSSVPAKHKFASENLSVGGRKVGFAAPPLYCQQVAELASLYLQNRAEEIKEHRPLES